MKRCPRCGHKARQHWPDGKEPVTTACRICLDLHIQTIDPSQRFQGPSIGGYCCWPRAVIEVD